MVQETVPEWVVFLVGKLVLENEATRQANLALTKQLDSLSKGSNQPTLGARSERE